MYEIIMAHIGTSGIMSDGEKEILWEAHGFSAEGACI
jgi:hypothetical protein